MKLSVVFTALAIALTFQTDGADAIFWQFIRPFFNGQKPGFLTVATGSSNGTASSGGTNQSAQGLNNSNAIFATNSNVSANISQVFNQPDAGTTGATTTESTTESTTETTTESTTESTTTTEAPTTT